MTIKETTYTETDKQGNVIRRMRKTVVTESYTDHGYDYGTRYGRGEPRQSGLGRILAAYEDDRRSREW